MLDKADIKLPADYKVELSHHYGIENFEETGASIITVVNRSYCKKYIVVLPGQSHPSHMHRDKEETFVLLYGDLEVETSSYREQLQLGQPLLIERGEYHAFNSKGGAVFEEISQRHLDGTSIYKDLKIQGRKLEERKSLV